MSSVRPATAKSRILIVEDHDDTRIMLGMMMQCEGFDVCCVASPAEALTCAQAFQPSVIISDIGLPQMDGYQLIEELRSLPGLEQVPAIALTGFAERAPQFQTSSSVFDLHLAKPVDYNLLFEKLNQLVQAI
ncbi:MAG: response regulator [Acidobacteriota bacterium]